MLFKSPNIKYKISDNEEVMMEKYYDKGYKCMISNNYDNIICEINDFMNSVRIKCDHYEN